ncbi:hypothetical protein [Exiguobacterium sp. K1]|uniref:hypothetical protein n=1 Tax=Exiguobacterium sp. K1 TaxID=2980105 RepID=UPI00299CF761|nr:hypothetical protein [Exiguobacterium sp. K1]MDX1260139.1 hypothetical protein [Exiguobacterium sp. K1]
MISLKHIIPFAGYDETLAWHIMEVDPARAALQIDVWYQAEKVHQMTVSFPEYDRFAHEFRKVHEQFPGIVSFEKGDFTFELMYDRLGHVQIKWRLAGERKHVLPSDQSYIGQALASIGVYM